MLALVIALGAVFAPFAPLRKFTRMPSVSPFLSSLPSVRTDATPDKTLIESVRDLGVLVPVVAVRTEDGVRVRYGHRRTRAAIEAGAGATVISHLVVASSVRAGTLVRIPMALPKRHFLILRHRERYKTKAEDELLKLILVAPPHRGLLAAGGGT